MFVAQLELADRAHHAAAFDAADCCDLEDQVASRNIGARRPEHSEHPGLGIGRSADHLDRIAGAGVDGQHLQLVGLGMTLCGQHPGDREWGKAVGGAHDPLDLEADCGQRLDDPVDAGIGLEMLLEPGQSEFHAPTPPDRVGTSRLRKP
jgi:hypothetical protein